MNRRALVLALTVLAAPPAQAGCLIFCGDPDLDPADALDRFEVELRNPLPGGVTLIGMIDGGFQDRFIQVRLTATAEGAEALLNLMQQSLATLGTRTAPLTGAEKAQWWDADTFSTMQTGQAKLDGFYETRIGIAPEPDAADRLAIFIFAFQV